MYGGSGISPSAASRSRGSSSPSSVTTNVSPAVVRAPTSTTASAGGVVQDRPGRQLARRPDERLPDTPVGVARFEQQHLAGTAGGPAQPQAGRDDPRVVDDDEVARPQQVGQVADVAVLRRGAATVDEQPGGVAWLDRLLGDQRRVEVVVEVLEAHQRQATVACHGRQAVPTACRLGGRRDGRRRVAAGRPVAGPGARAGAGDLRDVGEHMRTVADRLAAAGYVVAAPDVFWRVAPGWTADADEAGLAAAMETAGKLDRRAAARRLRQRPRSPRRATRGDRGRPGVIGFCLGGTLAFAAAIR